MYSVENEVQENTIGPIEIKYTRPKFAHRVLANMIDFIIFALLFVGGFLITRNIVMNSTDYSNTFNQLNEMKINSGLYVNDSDRIIDIVSYMESRSEYNHDTKIKESEKAIDKFFTYEVDYLDAEKYQNIIAEYDKLRLEKVDDSGTHYFVEEEGQIVKGEVYTKAKWLYVSFYENYIDNYLQGYLVTTPKYYDLTKTLNNYLIFIDLPIPFAISIVLTYFVPTLFFRRGRQTLGKALYRIGTVDSRFLSPTFWRNLAKWGIFFVEMFAGVASLGLIFIMSFTMMAFSKKRQGFPDYMLGLQEVDLTRNKVYMSMVEASLENVQTNKAPKDFRLIDHP